MTLVLLAGLGIGWLWGYSVICFQRDGEVEELSRAVKLRERQQQDAAARAAQQLQNELKETKQKAAQLQAELEQRITAERGRAEEEQRLRKAELEEAIQLRARREERQRQEEEKREAEKARRLKEAANTHKLVVDATWSNSYACCNCSEVRKLLAWRKGDLYGSCVNVWLRVNRIVNGEAPEMSVNPDGTAYLKDVFLLNDAVVAGMKCKGASGLWSVTKLPDGNYAVFDLRDTPFPLDAAELRKPLVGCAEDLTSGDPKRQIAGLRLLERAHYFSLIPLAIRLLDNVAVHEGQTVGSAAARALDIASSTLRQEDEPLPRTKDAWEKWWADLIAANPFPVVPLEPGKQQLIVESISTGFEPGVYVDPHGHFAVLAVSRFPEPPNQPCSGLRLLHLVDEDHAGDDFLYKVPPLEVHRRPEFLAGASTGTRVALAWGECLHHPTDSTVKFMTADVVTRQGTPVDLDLKRVGHLALCAMPGEQWLLAYSFVPPEEDNLNPLRLQYGLLLLDSSGHVLERPTPFHAAGNPAPPGDGAIVSLVKYPGGLAAAQVQSSAINILLLDEALALKRSVFLRDWPGFALIGPSCHVGLAVCGETLCAMWMDALVCTLSITGEKVSEAVRASAEHAIFFGGPVAVENGFAVIWLDRSQTTNQVRLSRVSLDGKLDQPRILFDSHSLLEPAALGAEGNLVRAIFYECGGFPQKVWFKLVDLERSSQPRPAK